MIDVANVALMTKPFVHRLAAMVDARLLTYREYMPWADQIIMREDAPPKWLLDLTVTMYIPDAVAILLGFAHSDPYEPLNSWVEQYVAASYLRYDRRELSWASFLAACGKEADGNDEVERVDFYSMLNQFEKSYFAKSVEAKQRRRILAEFGQGINVVRETFEAIRNVQVS